MKKVVKIKVEEIAVGGLNGSHFIGVVFHSGVRAVLVKLEDRKYISVSPKANSEYDSKIVYNNIQELVSDGMVKDSYVFDTGKELFTWVANQD